MFLFLSPLLNLVLNNNNFDQQTYNYSRDIDMDLTNCIIRTYSWYGPIKLWKNLTRKWIFSSGQVLTCVDPVKQVSRGKRNTLMFSMKIVFFGVQRKIWVFSLVKCVIRVLEMRKEECFECQSWVLLCWVKCSKILSYLGWIEFLLEKVKRKMFVNYTWWVV